MHKTYQPLFTVFISILTVFASCYVAFQISGSIWGKASVVYLAQYGGLSLESLQHFEIWRLFSSQLIHVYQQHMLYNVFSLLLVGYILEKRIGFHYMFAIWFLVGGLGTLFSTFFATAPWNIGTGASQAVMGMAGFGIVFVAKRVEPSIALKIVLALVIIPAVMLDIKSVGYPKPGHTLSFLMGFFISFIYLKVKEE